MASYGLKTNGSIFSPKSIRGLVEYRLMLVLKFCDLHFLIVIARAQGG